MAPETDGVDDDAWQAAIAGALLRQGAALHAASLALTVAALLAGVLLAFVGAQAGAAWRAVGAAVLLLGLAEFWLAGRVAFDADLFARLAARGGHLAAFDRAMLGLGLLPATKAGRPMATRIAGARRLFRLQGLAFGGQLAVLAGAAFGL